MVVNLNARDRATAAHDAAARYGKVSPFDEANSRPPSRPSSARPSARPSSAGTARTKLGNESPNRSPRLHWGLNFTVPRSFVEIAAGQHIDWLELQFGPKEIKFRELGAKLEAEAMEAAAREALLARNGLERDAGQREPARRIETARGNHGVMAGMEGMEAIKEMDPLAGVGLCIFLAGAIEQVPVMGGFFQTCRRWRLRNPH